MYDVNSTILHEQTNSYKRYRQVYIPLYLYIYIHTHTHAHTYNIQHTTHYYVQRTMYISSTYIIPLSDVEDDNTQYLVHSTSYTVDCSTLYSLHNVYFVLCTLYLVPCTRYDVYIVHSTYIYIYIVLCSSQTILNVQLLP